MIGGVGKIGDIESGVANDADVPYRLAFLGKASREHFSHQGYRLARFDRVLQSSLRVLETSQAISQQIIGILQRHGIDYYKLKDFHINRTLVGFTADEISICNTIDDIFVELANVISHGGVLEKLTNNKISNIIKRNSKSVSSGYKSNSNRSYSLHDVMTFSRPVVLGNRIKNSVEYTAAQHTKSLSYYPSLLSRYLVTSTDNLAMGHFKRSSAHITQKGNAVSLHDVTTSTQSALDELHQCLVSVTKMLDLRFQTLGLSYLESIAPGPTDLSEKYDQLKGNLCLLAKFKKISQQNF
jgi:hypothetical protein